MPRDLSIDIPGNPQRYQPGPLPRWEVLGTVADPDGAGALLRSLHTGQYCRANLGRMRLLPQWLVSAMLAKHWEAAP